MDEGWREGWREQRREEGREEGREKCGRDTRTQAQHNLLMRSVG